MPSRRRITASKTDVSDFDAKCLCGNCAVAFLEIHALDYCTPDDRTWSGLRCKPCLVRDLARLITILFEDGPLWCSSCDMILVELSDLVVRVQPLSSMV